MPPLRVIVMGGSLAGLASAVFLDRADVDVVVFERSQRPLVGRGAGIVLHPSVFRVLDRDPDAARTALSHVEDASRDAVTQMRRLLGTLREGETVQPQQARTTDAGVGDLAGLGKTDPAMALAMAIFMFSMAGIPPLAGFFSKLYVFLAAVQAGYWTLAVIGVLTSVVWGDGVIDTPAGQPFRRGDTVRFIPFESLLA